MDIQELAREFRTIRDERKAKKAAWEVEDKVLEEQLEALSDKMAAYMREAGATSMRTPAGTWMLSERILYWPSDWDSFYKFVDLHKAYHLMEKRVHAGNMTAFMQEHPGEFPEGLNIDRTFKATVRAT